MDQYIQYLKRKNSSIYTIYTYKSALQKFEIWLRNRTISTKLISLYLSSNNELKPSTIELRKRIIIGFLKFKKSKIVDKVSEIKVPRQSTYNFKTLSWDDIPKCHQDVMGLFKTLLYTGIRLNELNTIIIEGDSIKVVGKGNKVRHIPIANRLLISDILVARTMSKKKIYQYIDEHYDDWVTPHTFRRSFCTNLVKSGANLKIVSEMMGHVKLETTARYLHFNCEDRVKELRRYL